MDKSCHPERFVRHSVNRQAKLRQFEEQPEWALVAKESPVTSLGSCFADQIRMFLKEKGYNYVMREPNDTGSSANWGRVYSPVSLRQILEYSLNPDWHPLERWWTDAQGRTIDPYRAVPPYPDAAAAQEDFHHHCRFSREVFASAEVVILTYGLVEVWESVLDGYVFQGRPPAFDPTRHNFRLLEYPECLQAITEACDGIRHLNPGATLILTVSAVPLRATFRHDVSPVTANVYSKSALLAAVQTFCRRAAGAYYFPSYEIVTECVPDPFRPNGGVTSAAVDLVMSLFERHFVRR